MDKYRQSFEQQSSQMNDQQTSSPQQGGMDVDTFNRWQMQTAAREQQMMAQLQQERQTTKQYEDYVWQSQLAQVQPDQRPYVQAAKDYQDYLKQVGNQYNQMQGYTQQLEAAVLPMVKDRVFGHLAQQHGISKDILANAETPAEAEKIIRAVADFKKKSNFEQRKQMGVDAAPISSQTSHSSSTDSEISKKFRNSGDLVGYIRAKKAQGLW